MLLLSKQQNRSTATKVGLELGCSIYVYALNLYALNLGGLGKIFYAGVLIDDCSWQKMDI